jgi:hypothetical protein
MQRKSCVSRRGSFIRPDGYGLEEYGLDGYGLDGYGLDGYGLER